MAVQSYPFPPVGLTAVGVAAHRAAETQQSGALFEDHFAAGFVRAAGVVRHDGDGKRERPGLAHWIAVRTRFLDDVVLGAVSDGCRQVVIVGAGLDARAFRLDWPAHTRLWELDLADVLNFKDQVILAEGWQPQCERTSLAVDLSGDWDQRLEAAGFDAQAPVVWLAEGLLAYLAPEVTDSLIGRMAELSVSESRMGLTLAASGRLKAWQETHPDGKSVPGDYVALWRSAAPEDATEWLASFGWRAEVFDVAERSVAYGRPLEQTDGSTHSARLVEAIRT